MPETWMQDVRYALRLLRRSPLFTLTAALSLAIGIGANATIFSVASALLLRPLPGLADPQHLVDIGRTQNGRGFDTTSYPNYRDVRERATMLTGVYAWRVEPEPMSLAGQNDAERVYGARVTGNYFSVLGTRAQAGRLFTDADDTPGHETVTVLSYDLWQRRFGGDPAIVGQTITVTGQPFTVVGVAPAGFQGTTLLKSDLWLPLSTQVLGGSSHDMLTNRRIVWLMMGGRLKPGATLAQANAELASIGAALAREHPQRIAAAVAGTLGCVGLLLAAIGIYGVTSYAVSRRSREIGIRIALGADRGAVLALVLRQGLVLTVAGVAFGLVAGAAASQVLRSLLFGVSALDPLTYAAAATLFLGVALAASYAPARRATRVDPMRALRYE